MWKHNHKAVLEGIEPRMQRRDCCLWTGLGGKCSKVRALAKGWQSEQHGIRWQCGKVMRTEGATNIEWRQIKMGPKLVYDWFCGLWWIFGRDRMWPDVGKCIINTHFLLVLSRELSELKGNARILCCSVDICIYLSHMRCLFRSTFCKREHPSFKKSWPPTKAEGMSSNAFPLICSLYPCSLLAWHTNLHWNV